MIKAEAKEALRHLEFNFGHLQLNEIDDILSAIAPLIAQEARKQEKWRIEDLLKKWCNHPLYNEDFLKEF